MDEKEIPQINPATAAMPFNPLTGGKSLWRRLMNFRKEVWNDNDFWIHTMAVKGGASAIIAAGVISTSYVVMLPFFLAAVGIAACLGLIGLGVYGVLLGTAKARDKLKHIYYKTISTTPPKANKQSGKTLPQKLLENRHIRHLAEKPLIQKFLNSHVWKTTRKIAQKQQDAFLTGLAGGGAVFLGTLSAVVLITQIVLLPVVAVGSVLTLTIIAAASGVLSGGYGIYLSGQKLLRSFSSKKTAKKKNPDASGNPQTAAQKPPLTGQNTLAPVFNKDGASSQEEKRPDIHEAEKLEKKCHMPSPDPTAPKWRSGGR